MARLCTSCASIYLYPFLYIAVRKIQVDVVKKQATVNQLKEKIDENDRLKAAIQNLTDQIGRYNTALGVYDSLVPGSARWHKMLAQLTKGVEDLGAIWITDIRAMANGSMQVQGYALYRGRVPRIAALFDNSTLTRVEVKEIRDKTPPVYNFIITVPPQPDKPEQVSQTTDQEQ
jgi:Tfp pilus assembly protein PilN